ncbi:MAG: sulfite exporter TauE/SafE family protein [Hyphomicrobiaceae bacterium]
MSDILFPVYFPVAEVTANALILSGAGGAVGFLSGLFGVGGGFLMTPLLIMLGIPTEVAIATGANQAVATSVSSAYVHWFRGNVDAKMGFILLLGGFVGSILGVWSVALLRQIGQFDLVIGLSYFVLLGVIGAAMFIESVSAWVKSSGTNGSARGSYGHTWIQGLPFKTRFRRSKLYMSMIPPAVIGVFVGLMTAIMGVGGGFVLVPAMVYLLRMRTSVAIGTSAFQIVFVGALTTLLQASINHSVDILLATLLILGGVIGAQIGARVGARLKGEQLRALLALLVLIMSVRVGFDLVRKPSEIYSTTVLRQDH